MKLLSLDHVQLGMPPGGENEAVAFYAGVLGMEHFPKPAPLRASGGAWFRYGSIEIHLGTESDFRPSRKAHPAMLVDDLEGFAARCEAAGHEPEWDHRYPGRRRFYVSDPFGNMVELFRYEDSSTGPPPPESAS